MIDGSGAVISGSGSDGFDSDLFGPGQRKYCPHLYTFERTIVVSAFPEIIGLQALPGRLSSLGEKRQFNVKKKGSVTCISANLLPYNCLGTFEAYELQKFRT